MSLMRMIRPVDITAAMITSVNITEDDYSLWSSGATYAVGDRVISTTTHKVYERLIAGATSKNPSDDSHIKTARGKKVKRVKDGSGTTVTYAEIPDSDAGNWIEVGPTNRWAMFDQSISTQSTKTGSVVVTLTPGTVVNAVGLVGLSGKTARVQMIDATDGTVYDRTVNLQSPPLSSDYYSYFFDDIKSRDTAVFTDLPSYGSAAITITVDAGASAAKMGAVVIGKVFSIGAFGVQRGAKVGITDYSKKEFDAFGNALLLKRAYARRATFDLLIDNTTLDSVAKALADVRATPTLFIASDSYDATAIYGIYKDFDLTIAYPSYTQCSITLEGLT